MNITTRSNIIKLIVKSSLQAASVSFLSVLPGFFLRGGMSDAQIGIYNSLSQIVNMSVSLYCAGLAAGFSDSRKMINIILFLQAIFTAAYAIFCCVTGSAEVFYGVILLIAAILAIIAAVNTVYEYKLPCEVMDLQFYSVYVGYSGLFCGVISILIGAVLPVLFKHCDFYAVTGFSIIASAVCLLITIPVVRSMKPIGEQVQKNIEVSKLSAFDNIKKLLSDRDFLVLLVPNFLRGWGAGLVSMIAVIAMRAFSMEEGQIPLITAAANIGTVLSSFVYIYLVKKCGTVKTGLIGGVIFSVIIFSTGLDFYGFLIIYCISHTGFYIVSNAIPDMIYRFADKTIISAFHTWRLAVTAFGTAAATAVFGVLIESVPPVRIFAAGAAGYLLCVIGYYILYRNKDRAKNKLREEL